MKLNITCPKCKSPDISIVENTKGVDPIYRCNKCGYKKNLFPKFGNKEEIKEE